MNEEEERAAEFKEFDRQIRGDQKAFDYQTAIRACATAGAMISQCDLPEILAAISRAETLGPIVDPTLYIRKHKSMEQDKRLVEAALPLWRFTKELLKAVETTGGRG